MILLEQSKQTEPKYSYCIKPLLLHFEIQSDTSFIQPNQKYEKPITGDVYRPSTSQSKKLYSEERPAEYSDDSNIIKANRKSTSFLWENESPLQKSPFKSPSLNKFVPLAFKYNTIKIQSQDLSSSLIVNTTNEPKGFFKLYK